MPTDQPILIAGGGIGGLAAALGLARRDLPVIVLEKAPQFAEIGAGIQIAPNAFNCFDALGVGDAAHPMLQYWAPGACMALEDAVCLSRCIATLRTIDDAFAAYHHERFARTAQVQLGSRAIGDYIYRPSAGSAAARDAILGAKTDQDWFQTLNWLYGHLTG